MHKMPQDEIKVKAGIISCCDLDSDMDGAAVTRFSDMEPRNRAAVPRLLLRHRAKGQAAVTRFLLRWGAEGQRAAVTRFSDMEPKDGAAASTDFFSGKARD